MFCKNCGKEIPNDSKFCPECGVALAFVENTNKEKTVTESPKTSYKTAAEKEVLIRGFRYASSKKSKFSFIMTDLPTLGIFANFVLLIIFQGWLWFVLLGLWTLFYYVARFIFRQSIIYNTESKDFIYNAHSKVPSTKITLNINELKGIRFRYVKVTYNACYSNAIDMGKYHVISFDAVDDAKSFDVWFPKKGNAEEFLPIIESALAENNSTIKIDKKEELVKFYDFIAEEV